MSDKKQIQPIFFGGLPGAGKTTLICTLIQIALNDEKRFAGFKPFDTGLIQHNANETQMDGELICANMTGDPMGALVSPYIAHENYPHEMAFRRDGIRVDWNFIQKRIEILNDNYHQTLIELPPSLFTPITEQKMVIDWLAESKNSIIWVINPVREEFSQNLTEIQHLKSSGIPFDLVINNASKIMDQDLLYYIWEKVEEFAEIELFGMIPFIKNLDFNYKKPIPMIEKFTPDLIKKFLDKKTEQ